MKPQSNLTVNYPSMPELTARGMILGALITVIFTHAPRRKALDAG